MSSIQPASPGAGVAARALQWAGIVWFLVAAFGQAAFIWFILAFYGTRTAAGKFASWNDKPIIDGYIANDPAGNLVFAAHVLVASVLTFAGLMLARPTRDAVPVQAEPLIP